MVIHFKVKMPENGRKNIFTDKEKRKKIPLKFLDVDVVSESLIFRFWSLPTNKEGAMYVFSL